MDLLGLMHLQRAGARGGPHRRHLVSSAPASCLHCVNWPDGTTGASRAPRAGSWLSFETATWAHKPFSSEAGQVPSLADFTEQGPSDSLHGDVRPTKACQDRS